MPTRDELHDAPLDIVSGLIRAAVHADVGNDVLQAVFEDPRQLSTANATQMPLLAVYRFREEWRRRNSQQRVADIKLVFDYVMSSTSPNRRELRWPALQAVWSSLANAMLKGRHVAYQSDAKVLCDVGLQVHQDTAKVVYGFAEKRLDYPFFRGELMVTFTPSDADWQLYDLYLEHFTSFDVPGGDHVAPDIHGTDTTILPPYTG